MSIYPIKLSEWYPFGNEYYEVVYFLVNYSRCLACGNKVRYNKAVGHHSLIVGVGDSWCSWKCCKSGKVARTDKRRERRLNRKFTKYEFS